MAFKAAREENFSIRKAAKHFSFPKSTLSARVAKEVDARKPARPTVFSMEDEKFLVNHIKHMESNGFGLGIQEICQLAYEMVEDAKLSRPSSGERELGMIGTKGLCHDIHRCH